MYVSRLAVWRLLGCVDTGDAERFDIGKNLPAWAQWWSFDGLALGRLTERKARSLRKRNEAWDAEATSYNVQKHLSVIFEYEACERHECTKPNQWINAMDSSSTSQGTSRISKVLLHISYVAIVRLGPMGDPSFLLLTGKLEMRRRCCLLVRTTCFP